MDTKPASNPELFLEAEEAQRQAELIIGLGEQILQEAREAKYRAVKRVRQIAEYLELEEENTQEEVV
jgi:hypothetical protein